MAAIDKLLQAAISSQTDAVYLEPGRLPRFRRDGSDREVTQSPLDARAVERLLAEVAPGRRMPDPGDVPRWEFDHEVDGMRVHFACLATAAGWSALASPDLSSSPAGRPAEPGPALGAAAPDKGRKPMPPVETLLRAMLELGASDLHLAAYEPPLLRLHGELQPFEIYAPETSARLKELLFEITPERYRAEFERANSACFVHEIHEVARYRVQLARSELGVGAAIRHIPLVVPTAAALELAPACVRLAEERHGLVLCVSPASSGRSSLLAALVDQVNRQRRCLILTLESPVEFVHVRQRSLVLQREIPAHAPTIAAALHAARMENVDLVAIGDLEDAGDIRAALDLAASGTLVFAAVRAASVHDALLRLAADGRGELLATGLRGAIGQILLPLFDGSRVAVREVLLGTAAIRKLLHEGRIDELAAAQSRATGDGAIHQNEALAEMVALRRASPREAAFAAADSAAFIERLRVIDPSGQLAREAAAGA